MRNAVRDRAETRPQATLPTSGPHILDYVFFVRHHWIRMLVVILVCLVAGLGLYFITTPKYKARTDVVVVAVSDLSLTGKNAADVSIDSAVQVLLSDRVLGETARELNYPGRSSGLLNDMTISPLINSRILRIYVSSTTPKRAYDAVTLLAKNFLDARQSSLEQASTTRVATIEAQLKSIEIELAGVDADASHRLLDSTKSLTEQQNRLQTELIAITVNTPEPGYISHTAEMPTMSARSGLTVYAGSSLAIGLILACLVARTTDSRQSSPTLSQPASTKA